MSSLKVSDYVLALKSCYLGHECLEKCYQKMQQLHKGLLLDARTQGGSCLEVLKDFNPLMNDAVLSLVPCSLSFLKRQILKQEARAQSTPVPIWDYTLVLNDQQNVYSRLSQWDLEIKRLLQRIEHVYRFYAWRRGILWVEQLKKPQAAAQSKNETTQMVLQKIQDFLDKIPLTMGAQKTGVFEALMAHLKVYQGFISESNNLLKKSAKDDEGGPPFLQGGIPE